MSEIKHMAVNDIIHYRGGSSCASNILLEVM